jgi:hypothetical protein
LLPQFLKFEKCGSAQIITGFKICFSFGGERFFMVIISGLVAVNRAFLVSNFLFVFLAPKFEVQLQKLKKDELPEVFCFHLIRF